MHAFLAAVILLSATPASSEKVDRAVWLERHGKPPVEYLLDSFAKHRVVIAGEAHWIRHDAELIAATIPHLPAAGVRTVAVETFSSDAQETIDRLVSANVWNDEDAVAVLRAGAWPYREYGEILRAAWQTNLKEPGSIRVVGLGPPLGWREKNVDYDAFMAAQILKAIGPGGKALVLLGLHHAFTRYEQPTVLDDGRVDGFVDRTGNILRRSLGEFVFLVVLHRPVWCGSPRQWSYCHPASGAIDCAAAGRARPVGFDLADSPFEAIEMDPAVYYAHGYPSLRLIDFADGWIWFSPIEEYRGAELISLEEFAPDANAMNQVRQNNPFSNKAGLTDVEIAKLWAETAARMENFRVMRRWTGLPPLSDLCANQR
jgi:hypothetical protein